MFIALTKPTVPDSQRANAAAFAAAQTLLADDHGINIPSTIMAPDWDAPTDGFYPAVFACPDEAPLAVIIAGAVGIPFMQGTEALEGLTIEELLQYMPNEYGDVVMSNRSAADEALTKVKQTLVDNGRLFKELQDETYCYGSYIPYPQQSLKGKTTAPAEVQ